ncbi:MAG TPA: hypothetical protein VJM12_04655 [Pyrinomonadaceae bacterium]|nr:hypothetical protein [Pyrinomonadaceae bacterium]
MELAESRRHITLSQFTATFVPFALLLAAALMVPELPQIIEHHRAVYTIEALVYYRIIHTIWLTMAFLIVAEVLYFWPGDSEQKRNFWLLCWTFGFLAYVVHFYYTVGVVFHGSLREVYAKQGVMIATSNLLVTAWWGFDLILAWFVRSRAKWIRIQRTLAHLYIPITFFISAVVIKRGFVRGLGIVMTVAILISILARLISRKHHREAIPQGEAI